MDFGTIMQAVFADGHTLVIPSVIDYAAVIVGALTGALIACDRKLDIVGTIVAGLLTGFGGGIVRDLLMQDHGIYFMQHADLMLLCVGICVLIFYFRGIFSDPDRQLFLLDILSVALFALAGASKAFACDQGIIFSIVLGSVTAVGGGALRDVFTGAVPVIFRASNFYAVAGFGGSVAYVSLAALGCPVVIAGVVCIVVVLALRYGSVRFGWQTRAEADYSPRVKKAFSNISRRPGGGKEDPEDR